MKEATSIIDLAFWKVEMEEKAGLVAITHRSEIPGPAKDKILGFLTHRYPGYPLVIHFGKFA